VAEGLVMEPKRKVSVGCNNQDAKLTGLEERKECKQTCRLFHLDENVKFR